MENLMSAVLNKRFTCHARSHLPALKREQAGRTAHFYCLSVFELQGAPRLHVMTFFSQDACSHTHFLSLMTFLAAPPDPMCLLATPVREL